MSSNRRLSKDEKDALFQRVLEHGRVFVRDYDPQAVGIHKDPRRYCAILAAATVMELELLGLQGLYQAGSASWRMVPRRLDDGRRPTHYSYVYDFGRAAKYTLAGTFPEMHCWALVCYEHEGSSELIDFTTAILPDSVKLAGFRWLMPDPPQYVWERVDVLRRSDDCHYVNNPNAISMAKVFLKLAKEKAVRNFLSRG